MQALCPRLCAESVIALAERGYAIGHASVRKFTLARFLLATLPLPLSSLIVTSALPPYALIHRPTSSELAFGVAQALGSLAAIGFTLRYCFGAINRSGSM